MLSLRGVSYRYPGAGHETLHAVDLELHRGTVTGLAGAAEAGKSTLCLVAGGLAPRVVGGRMNGAITVDGEDISGWPMHRLAERVVTGLQDPGGQLSLIAETVLGEVAFGPANLGLPRDEVVGRSEEALRTVGIADLHDHDPTRLSGGEQQLVVIAGLLAMRPRYLILDEPIAHLDAAGARLVLEAIRAAAATGTAVLLAEQRALAWSACDVVAVLGHGNIVAAGAPNEVLGRPGIAALGIEEPAELRLRRRLVEAGLDPDLAESAS